MNKNIFKILLTGFVLLGAQFIASAQSISADAILTPKAGPEPKINGAKIFGVRPNHPILYTIPASGKRPMTFSAKNLPKGVTVDQKTGK